jgi:hypothetical protein
MYFKLGLLVCISFNMFAGEQMMVRKNNSLGKCAKYATRGKKRNQQPISPLGIFAACGAQLSQKKPNKSSQRGPWRKAEKEAALYGQISEPYSKGQVERVETLLQKHRVDPNLSASKSCGISYPLSPLCIAAGKGNVVLVELLLKYKANVHKESFFSGKHGDVITTPLLCAAYGGKDENNVEGRYADVIKQLYNAGCDMNVGGDSKKCPFTAPQLVVLQRNSTYERKQQLLNTLSKCEADLCKESFNKYTVADLAFKRGDVELAQWLDTQEVSRKVRPKNQLVQQKKESHPDRRRKKRFSHRNRAMKKDMWRDYSVR